MAVPYVFLTGFLGSGKTTLLNGLLERYGDRRIGVIVNDFGDMGLDASLIEGSVAGEVRELKAGQIFCSCLSGSFVKSVLAYEEIKPDLLLVECSGLAKPSSLADITRAISLEAPGVFSYGGMICLIDAQRHLILEKTLMVLGEQMASSDLFLITKTDLLTPQEKKELRDHLESAYDKPIIEAVMGRIDVDILDLLETRHDAYRKGGGDFSGWGEKGRPLTFVYLPRGLTADEIRRRILPHLNRLYRIKGVAVTSDRGRVLVDGTSAGIDFKKAPEDVAPGLVVITHDAALEGDLTSP